MAFWCVYPAYPDSVLVTADQMRHYWAKVTGSCGWYMASTYGLENYWAIGYMPSERTIKDIGRRPRPFVKCHSSGMVECEIMRIED
ncbi:hypothetical protein PGQ11_002914 [Apiospora arundinis]|uniref:Uncharacterized protein n=1 Tax=Apiospora arundinis TaxID=335852 RepID=A0ABR2J438_9PEZI